jgi:FdhD protein
MTRIREVGIERVDSEGRRDTRDRVIVEAPLELRARGHAVATIMRTPGHDLELVRGLLNAESIAIAGRTALAQIADDTVEIDVDPAAFASRGLLSTAACGVCGRVAVADLELHAHTVDADTSIASATLAALPDLLRTAQPAFDETGGLHAAGLFMTAGVLVAAREDVGRHNAVDKIVGFALDAGLDPSILVLCLSGRVGYELVQKAVRFGVPIVCAVSAPTSLAIDLAERFGVALAGFVRGGKLNVYAHGWRIRASSP